MSTNYRNRPNKNALSMAGICICLVFFVKAYTQDIPRVITELGSDWLFMNKEVSGAARPDFRETGWKKVRVPHDWAISGPFRQENDLQTVRVTEDGEEKAMTRSGRTGGLPYAGIGWYRKHLTIGKTDQGKNFHLEFDGAMSHAQVFVNNRFAGEWPYGYASFSIAITPYLRYGADNVIAVRLENKNSSARWYPGAGIYRKVRLVKTNAVHVAHWGSFITTPLVSPQKALIKIQTTLETVNKIDGNLRLETSIYNQHHEKIAENTITPSLSGINYQEIFVPNPKLWSAESPALYYAITRLKQGKLLVDEYRTNFGIRSIRFSTEKGMQVNGIQVKLKGVCMHDDLGALGMAFNKSILKYRLQLLKNMGCNAIRGTHNPQAPEILELCDEMGFYFIDEAFDEWKIAKVDNGYHTLFDQWVEKDLGALIRRDRNHPSLIMYSIGNEVKEQNDSSGARVARRLTDICHKTDSTRPVTAGFNNMTAAIKNGLADVVDIPGWNYKPEYYSSLHKQHPGWVIYGSETVSTVSSRGIYQLPAEKAIMKTWPDNQSSSFDLEYCSWSQLPDMEWVNQEPDFVAGEFVWTGIDYLGEPTPYSANWPSRSAYFGIIDLSGIPKDRYYLYQSHWTNQPVLHVLPHWNWEGMEGKNVPVYAYTNYPSAELFINGKSFGKKTFSKTKLLDRYRLRWENAIYQPGEIKVVAYDETGRIAETKNIKTSGIPARIMLETRQQHLTATGEDIALVTVSVVDQEGNLCPKADNLIQFSVEGEGFLRAVDNGNPASLEPFEANYRKTFSGKCMAFVQSSHQQGTITIKARSTSLLPAVIKITNTK